MPPGKDLLVLLSKPALLHLGFDDWKGVHDRSAEALGLGLHGLVLSAEELSTHAVLNLTVQWLDTDTWLGRDYRIALG